MATYYSSDLEWLILRKNNAFIHKRVAEGPIFSREPGNLVNIHSHKYSGLANSKSIDIQPTASGAIKITHRAPGASPHAVASARKTTVIRPRTGGRRALGIGAGLAKQGYRADVRAQTLARTSRLVEAQKEPKADLPKKVRGKKAVNGPV
ncbi:ribosomal L28e protein family-domain-containing protein [Vararia minispora EC-137]|uniref:Ribosomal L28e protein family-domain-containing protein n=1 Tax=Vararia minispora EC-137 TaxID=1314806 RepID=A0ACB8QPY0_9AGAM|nr:ribosomal L28e protein family-domain-containing protein [Vararia minispora EC-137]